MTQGQIIATTNKLIAIPSTVDNLGALQDALQVIADMLATRKDVTVERFESNGKPSLFAFVGAKRPKKFDLILGGHLDVVPGQAEQFKPYVKGNHLYGRGVYDMKMACVIMTDIFLQYAGNSQFELGLQMVTDEEVGGYDGVDVQLATGLAADLVILGEMTDLGVCNQTRGVCWVEAAFKGRNAHGGYTWDGHNAVNQASDFVQKVLRKFPLPPEKAWVTTANIASIATDNETYNRVPDSATVKIDFRFKPGDPHFKDRESVKAFIRDLDEAAEVTNIPVLEQAVMVPETDPHLARFMKAYTHVSGKQVELIRRYASSDARHFATVGQHAIEFGLGGNHLHADDEYVDLTTIEPFRATIEQYILDATAAKVARKKVTYQLV